MDDLGATFSKAFAVVTPRWFKLEDTCCLTLALRFFTLIDLHGECFMGSDLIHLTSIVAQ